MRHEINVNWHECRNAKIPANPEQMSAQMHAISQRRWLSLQAIAAQCNRNGLLTRQSRNCQLLLALEGKFCVQSSLEKKQSYNHIYYIL